MNLPPPSNVAEIIAYPIREIPCPLCSPAYPTPPRDLQRIERSPSERLTCRRCNGAGTVYRAVSAFRIVE